MALFESKETKSVRRQVAIRMAKKKVQRYISDCKRMSNRYTDMAKRALTIGQKAQGDQYICQRIRYERQANKWDGFLLSMEDLSLRGQMSGAMSGLVTGMQALTKEIRAGASVKEMTRAISELNITMTQLDQTENQLGEAMDGLDYEIGTPMDDAVESDIPDDMKEEVARMRSEFMDEVVVQEKVGTGRTSMRKKGGRESADTRIKDGMNRLKEMKKKAK